MSSSKPSNNIPEVTLVGAGLVGSLLSLALSRKGHRVRVFERRPDLRVAKISAGRSINLAISVRGLSALKEVGLEKEALEISIPMRGRLVHALDGTTNLQRYGKDDSECIRSISRGELNKLLLTAAEKTGLVKFEFQQRLLDYLPATKELCFENEETHTKSKLQAEFVIGTDGAHSELRNAFERHGIAKSTASVLDYSYKELHIAPLPGGKHALDPNALHIWPRKKYMLIALPNQDGSFTCTLFLATHGKTESFEALNSPQAVRAFFHEQFKDAVPLLENLEETFFSNPTGQMVTVKTSPWNLNQQAMLLGDAAHAIVPFFGQGMNCGFEDCSILETIWNSENPGACFQALYESRKPNADAIANMALENFIEMRDKVADPRFMLEKQIEAKLSEWFPDQYISRYRLVSFSRTPYSEAYARGERNQKVLDAICSQISSVENLTREMAERVLKIK